jgi:hypothetical protein
MVLVCCVAYVAVWHRATFRCDAWNKRFFDNPGLGFFRELPAPASSGDNLEPAHLNQLRLKRMVKRRHKPISDSQIGTLAHHNA